MLTVLPSVLCCAVALTHPRIVKDEATSIEAVIRSSMAHMDSWYIMDTGSTDGTQEIIHRVMADYPHAPGVLEELPFVDFATTRNIALKRSGNGTMFVLLPCIPCTDPAQRFFHESQCCKCKNSHVSAVRPLH